MATNLLEGTNSYIKVTDADLYFADRLYSDAWNNASADQKAQALIMASKRIDRLSLRGKKADQNQTMKFPRAIYANSPGTYAIDPKAVQSYPGWVYEISVAQCVKEAVCEEALILLKGDSQRTELQAQGVHSFQIGNLSETFTGEVVKLLSPDARELLRKYIAGSVSIV